MYKNCLDFSRACLQCQFHLPLFIHHQLAEPLKNVIAYWPFQIWALDFVGPISPPTSMGRRYILTTIEDFTKWGEVVAFRQQTSTKW